MSEPELYNVNFRSKGSLTWAPSSAVPEELKICEASVAMVSLLLPNHEFQIVDARTGEPVQPEKESIRCGLSTNN